MVRTEFPQVELLANDVNLGYGAAANQAVASCAAEHVLILNGDTVVRPGTLRALAAYLDQYPRVGMAGPRLTNPDGSLQPSYLPFPTQFYLLAEMANLKQLIRKSCALQNHVAASKLPNPRIGGSWSRKRRVMRAQPIWRKASWLSARRS